MRTPRVALLSGLLCILIGTAVFSWRARRLDEELWLTPAKMEGIQAQANAAQAETDRLPEYPLPDELSKALTQPNDFRKSRKVADIPNSVRSAFAKAAREENFSMADPNGRWEATDAIFYPWLPRRRLASVAIAGELCLIFYEHGGIGRNDNVAAFRMTRDYADPIWHAYVGHDVTSPTALTKVIQEKNYDEGPFF